MLAWGSCGRKGRKDCGIGRFERDFQAGKTFKYYFQCRRADIFEGPRENPAWALMPAGRRTEGLMQFNFADLDCGLRICVV